MRTNSIDSTRSKPRKTKNHSKSKSQLNPEEIEESESNLLSPVDRVRVGHLATTPVTPAGNIVDMQGSLDQSPPEKIEEEKTENKESAVKNLEVENNKEESQDASKEPVISGENVSGNDPEISQIPQKENESSENKSEAETTEMSETDAESLGKETVVETQGIFI